MPEPASIIDACARLLKPGGRLFLSTLNRTPAAFALAIVGAEYIARVLPKGTHQYRDFIKPSELAKWLRTAGLELEDVSGLMYEPWRNGARVVPRTDINYLACARKPALGNPKGRHEPHTVQRGAVRHDGLAGQRAGHGRTEPHARCRGKGLSAGRAAPTSARPRAMTSRRSDLRTRCEEMIRVYST